jgi:hypothetical protein
MTIAHQINTLANFLGPRDVAELTQKLFRKQSVNHKLMFVRYLAGRSSLVLMCLLKQSNMKWQSIM